MKTAQSSQYIYFYRPMAWLLFSFVAMIFSGCDSPDTPAHTGPPTAASVVPAASDLVISMGAGEQLVGISSYDRSIPGTDRKPIVGDYLNVDWEKLGAIRPRLLIVQMDEERMPPGFEQKANGLNIEIVNVKFESLGDVNRMLALLGEKLERPDLAAAATARLQQRLGKVRARAAAQPTDHRPTMLLVTGETGTYVAGRQTYLHELINIAGARNAVAHLRPGWISLDGEQLRKIDPDIIVHLLPAASDQVVEQSRKRWAASQLKANRNGRIYLQTQWYISQPGYHVGEVAEILQKRVLGE